VTCLEMSKLLYAFESNMFSRYDFFCQSQFSRSSARDLNNLVSKIYVEDLHIFQSRSSFYKSSRVAISSYVQWRIKISNIHIVCDLTMNIYIH